MKIYELAKEVNPYVVEMRRYFHEHPELSNQEDKTIERIGQELAGMGIEYEVVPHGGIVAILEGKTPSLARARLSCCVPTAMRCRSRRPRRTWLVPVSAAPRWMA